MRAGTPLARSAALRHFACRRGCSIKCEVARGPRISWLTDSSEPVQRSYDAILVLAGGQRTDGTLPGWVQRRLDASLDIQRHQVQSCPIVCLGGGTPHKPPIIRPTGFVLHEGTECAEYLIAKGVEPYSLLKEASSYDTVGNGYFGLTIHALPAGWRSLAVVTSDFHMPRSRAIFDFCFGMGAAAFHNDPEWFKMAYHAVSDDGLFPEEVLAARLRREAQSLKGWQKTTSHMQSLVELHHWLHMEHLCYAVPRQHEFGVQHAYQSVDDKALESY